LMNLGSGLTAGEGMPATFFTGVLATVVAAPCTAPFMASAIGFALTLDYLTTLAIFASLGVGMALPYLLLCYSPGLLRRMPRPGLWMETFKELLAFPMFASAVWLVWVLSQQAGPQGVVSVLSGAVMLAGAAWLWRKRGGGTLWRAVSTSGAILLVLVALYLPFGLTVATRAAQANPVAAAEDYEGPEWETWTPERQAELRAQGPLFVNFTAAWCITCKVNETVALDSARVKAAFAEKGVHYLKGDWTNEDADITAALAEYERSGVPLYLLYTPSRQRATVLPQILTESIVLQAIESL